ncbi:MAG: FAD binding domain-containing protein [Pseudonocardiaceae bacterium]
MDLHTITALRRPGSRVELSLGPGAAVLAGGTWLFSEPQPELHTLVDLRGLGWTPLEVTSGGLRIAATCTLRELAAWPAPPLLHYCCTALAGSFKIWHEATVGGNICLGLPAGPMIAMAVALDGIAVVWPAEGERRLPVAEFVTGVRRTALGPGDVLRAVEIPDYALRARTAYRRIALSPLGRSAALVIARHDQDGRFSLTVTAATERPYLFRFPVVPSAVDLREALAGIERWVADVHGAPDWREHVTGLLAEEIRVELS